MARKAKKKSKAREPELGILELAKALASPTKPKKSKPSKKEASQKKEAPVSEEKAPSKSSLPKHTKADYDYISPMRKEMARELKALLALDAVVLPKAFQLPNLNKMKPEALAKLIESLGCLSQVEERATLYRILNAKKVEVPKNTPTPELVQMVMQCGGFGRVNKREES